MFGESGVAVGLNYQKNAKNASTILKNYLLLDKFPERFGWQLGQELIESKVGRQTPEVPFNFGLQDGRIQQDLFNREEKI